MPIRICIDLCKVLEKDLEKLNFAKFDKATNIIKVSYRAHIQEKWMILYVCLKEKAAKSIRFNPHDLLRSHFGVKKSFLNLACFS